ncbi:MAG: cob(I)yrinic acid a,c-diamide adenosyltransferase [Paludibacteraceae bacterium]|nr:cob(I)yrinic acid a,c-diamide adenosyltransferase [Paludibacteraceae bacterium]
MKIYTKGGDKGRTSLASGQRVAKSDMRLEAYGTIDELNSFVGLLRSSLNGLNGDWIDDVDVQLGWVQNRLFDVGAILAGAPMEFGECNVERLEIWMDEMDAQLPVLKEFVLPGGSEETSRCHVCRCVARRAERCVVRCIENDEKSVDGVVLRYVNRLSDYFFILSRFIAKNLEIIVFVWEK